MNFHANACINNDLNRFFWFFLLSHFSCGLTTNECCRSLCYLMPHRPSHAIGLAWVCLSVCVSVWPLSSQSHFLIDFHQIYLRSIKLRSKNEFVGVNIASLPLFAPKTPILDQEVLKIWANINKLIFVLNVCESPKFAHYIRKWGWGTSGFRPEVEIWPFRACSLIKICNITLIYGRIGEILAYYKKFVPRNAMVTSAFGPGVKYGRFAHAHWKIYMIILIYGRIASPKRAYCRNKCVHVKCELRSLSAWMKTCHIYTNRRVARRVMT